MSLIRKLIATSISGNDLMPLDAPPGDSASRKLRELQDLRKDGVITEEEFQKKRKFLLDKL